MNAFICSTTVSSVFLNSSLSTIKKLIQKVNTKYLIFLGLREQVSADRARVPLPSHSMHESYLRLSLYYDSNLFMCMYWCLGQIEKKKEVSKLFTNLK